MAYAGSKDEPQVGDLVLGDRIKGRVGAVKKDGAVTVVTKGPWNPEKDLAGELRTDLDHAKLTLLRRAKA